ADLTVSMGAHKSGLFLGKGYEYTGITKAVEIGIPRFILEDAATMDGCARTPNHAWIQSRLPERSLFAHKYSVGMTLIVAGSSGLTGAATLACLAAEQSGSGAVVCAAPEDIQPVLAGKMTEVMTMGIPSSSNGIDTQKALALLAPRLQKARAVLIGCGMGQLPETQSFIRTLATSHTDCPIILDADGLNVFQGHTHLFKEHARGEWILTPHLGEFKRLAGGDVDLRNLVETVQKYAVSWNCVLILKGAPSLVGTPDGSVYINPGVNNALATAGTGDVLAGLCAGLLSQGLSPIDAALCALHIGLTAADSYTSEFHSSTMRASDLIRHIRTVLSKRYY
ncbi:MAG: NAD(P)H-hydrate dehydratase, partial [Rhodothermaceae bacterium]|nr:NAD(P)H-hydrate dehydratase [Rhodothermaceae bacterium]